MHSGLTVGAQSLLRAVLSLLWVVLAYIIAYSRTTVENCIYLYCECDFDSGLDFSSISRTECEIDANRSFECENDTLSLASCLGSVGQDRARVSTRALLRSTIHDYSAPLALSIGGPNSGSLACLCMSRSNGVCARVCATSDLGRGLRSLDLTVCSTLSGRSARAKPKKYVVFGY